MLQTSRPGVSKIWSMEPHTQPLVLALHWASPGSACTLDPASTPASLGAMLHAASAPDQQDQATHVTDILIQPWWEPHAPQSWTSWNKCHEHRIWYAPKEPGIVGLIQPAGLAPHCWAHGPVLSDFPVLEKDPSYLIVKIYIKNE